MNKRSNERHQVLMSGTISFQDSKSIARSMIYRLLGQASRWIARPESPIHLTFSSPILASDLVVSFGAKRSGLVLLSHSQIAHEAAQFPE
jgi:hypothetical protein